MINIAEILKDCPKGTKLYSPICGDCTFEKIHLNTSIVVCTQDYRTITFNVYGQYFRDIDNAECLLFPSNKNRDWNTFRTFKDGDIISSGSYIAIFHKFGKPKSCEYDKVVYYHCWCYQNGKDFKFEKDFGIGRDTEYNFATDEEKQKLFDVIKENGYKWNSETKTLEKLIEPKFKVGDRIKWIKNGNIYEIIKILSNCYIANYLGSDITILWNRQDDYELVPNYKFKVGDKIVKKDDPTKSWYVQGIDTYCNSDYYYIITKGQVSNLHFKDQDEWELLVAAPKFKVGDKIKEKCESFPSTRTIDSYVEGIGYFTTIRDWVRIEDQDNWELVPTYKFKVGDIITNGKVTIKIGHIDGDYYYDITRNIATRLFIKFQDEWELVPNKFDITTLKAYDKVLVRDDNNSAWVNAFFGFCDTTTNKKYPFIAGSVNWTQCIPYKGNEHLLGTTNDCDEFYKNW